MNKFERGDLVKAAAFGLTPAAIGAATAADQYWRAYRDKSIGLVTKADAIYIWVRWCGLRSDNANHMYLNDIKYFELVSRIDHD